MKKLEIAKGAGKRSNPFAPIETAVEAIRAGRMVIVVDDEDRENEAAVDVARIAGLNPSGVVCEVMTDDGTMARVPQLTKFAKKHGLLMITVADLIKYRMRTESLVKRVATAKMPTEYGQFKIFA